MQADGPRRRRSVNGSSQSASILRPGKDAANTRRTIRERQVVARHSRGRRRAAWVGAHVDRWTAPGPRQPTASLAVAGGLTARAREGAPPPEPHRPPDSTYRAHCPRLDGLALRAWIPRLPRVSAGAPRRRRCSRPATVAVGSALPLRRGQPALPLRGTCGSPKSRRKKGPSADRRPLQNMDSGSADAASPTACALRLGSACPTRHDQMPIPMSDRTQAAAVVTALHPGESQLGRSSLRPRRCQGERWCGCQGSCRDV